MNRHTSELQQSAANTALEARRSWLTSAASGLGAAALADLLQRDGVLAGESADSGASLRSALSHFAPRAKNCIFLFQAGAPHILICLIRSRDWRN